MTYQKNFVVSIKSNGKILREVDERVYLPFGSEYQIILKNLDRQRRAKVRIFIDGESIGANLVLRPSERLELERFLLRPDKGNRFKFIEKTEGISKHRGNRFGDGLVQVDFCFEDPIITDTNWVDYPDWTTSKTLTDSFIGMSDTSFGGQKYFLSDDVSSTPCYCALMDTSYSTKGGRGKPGPSGPEGITVPGSISNQEFIEAERFQTGPWSTIILYLRGGVERPLTVETKLRCRTCGRKSPSSSKFCYNCGTSLEII